MASIRQIVLFQAKPAHIYELLTDSVLHEAFTGASARIGTKPGEPYFSYDGYITGEILELVPAKLIRKTWIASEEAWPDGQISEIRLDLKPEGENTIVEFNHTNVPEILLEQIENGWREYYWNRIQAFLEF
jgi:uncharacterized protein YndB with AHSA1/START domain